MRARTATIIAAILLAACSTGPRDMRADAAPIGAPNAALDAVEVMVVGAFHMGNPGQDVVNAKTENMLTPHRQTEIADVVEALRAFNPTVIAVERITSAPSYVDPKYTAFTPDMLTATADERVQIAYRLANALGVDRVYGVDEQPEGDEPDYFPFGELAAQAAATGRQDLLDAQIASIQASATRFEAMQKDHSVAELLLETNREAIGDGVGFYYAASAFDTGETQPGAELQAYWFMRNAKIFSKLMQVTKPGDRVVVVYGAGHKYWLDHFAGHTPGYASIDVFPYLEEAARK